MPSAPDPSQGVAVELRRAGSADSAQVADVYLAAFHATYTFPLAHTDDQVRAWIRDEVVSTNETWVAVEGPAIVGLMVLADDLLDQLYVRPDRWRRGIGSRLVELAKERRPDGLDLYTFQENAPARAFYERHGFGAVWFGDGSANEEGQPDVRYAWRPGVAPADIWSPTDPGPPSGRVESPDGASIAWFRAGDGPPLLLIHGATADHTTFRVVGPRFAARHAVYAMDRRGRGSSGDAPPGVSYTIEREYEDVATVLDAVAAETGSAVDVLGHSFGGRVALGAAPLTQHLRSLVTYESAPAPRGMSFERPGLVARLRELEAAGDSAGLLRSFMTEVVGMTADEFAAFQANPVWPVRLAAAHTLVRELTAEAGDGDEEATRRLARAVRVPVLQLLGGESRDIFAAGTTALDNELPDGRVVVLPGQKHAAHHGDPDRFVAEVEGFLAEGGAGGRTAHRGLPSAR
jgi:pimeloyl-ACP methyl ester carboxylesterase/ribosomal protein S18 acetylase RimI-like enzyme